MFVYRANQDCLLLYLSATCTQINTQTHPCSDFLSAHSQIQWALQKNTHLAAQFFHVPVPFRPDSKALNISGVLRRVCNMVIPVSGLAFPVSVPIVGLLFDSTGAKSYLEGGQPACEPLAVNSCTLTHNVLAWVAHRISYIDILQKCACIFAEICTCLYTFRWLWNINKQLLNLLTHMLQTCKSTCHICTSQDVHEVSTITSQMQSNKILHFRLFSLGHFEALRQ